MWTDHLATLDGTTFFLHRNTVNMLAMAVHNIKNQQNAQ